MPSIDTAFSGDDSASLRALTKFAHALVFVLAVAVVVRAATWFDRLVWLNTLVTLVLLTFWFIASSHRRRNQMCLQCIEEVPADAPLRAERQKPLLRLVHFANSIPGFAVVTALVLGPSVIELIVGWERSRVRTIPGDLWLFAAIYSEWVHHRLRPWCTYCDRWDEGGDAEPSPDPIGTNAKTV
ncbi:hypothetical protein [Antrihabitans spumae]|jgi:multisubunit Na+/H+ antiporter MnhF subunit|uniref:Uncharacterized protein n=1 Tax=Antrihabitans spumae TaxID=3373370 RepID=A0ABW7K7N5_9NOCA